MDWIHDILLPFIWALLGGLLTLIGTLISFRHEKKVRRDEEIDKAKPIFINYMIHQVNEKSNVAKYLFDAEEETANSVTGVFKNTDNGLGFFDYIKTEAKTYYPKHSTTVDKGNVFFIILKPVAGESLKSCKIYFHDIFGNKYFYNAHFHFESGAQSEIIIEDNMPIKCK